MPAEHPLPEVRKTVRDTKVPWFIRAAVLQEYRAAHVMLTPKDVARRLKITLNEVYLHGQLVAGMRKYPLLKKVKSKRRAIAILRGGNIEQELRHIAQRKLWKTEPEGE
jgi:hypothetical protein